MTDGTQPRGGHPPAIPAVGRSQPRGHNPGTPRPAAAGPGQPAPSGRATAATVAAYAAAIAAFSYALLSAYWALGGHGLVSTVGGYAAQFARRGGAAPVLLALAAAAAKAAGGLLALALVRPWGRIIPRGWLRAVSAAASALLVAYGAVNVLAAALVLCGVLHPAGRVDRGALRWHAGVWDLWFLIWGILLAQATTGSRQRSGSTDRPINHRTARMITRHIPPSAHARTRPAHRHHRAARQHGHHRAAHRP